METKAMEAWRVPMEVTFGDRTYRPVMTVWVNGMWKLEGHEAMKAAMDAYDERMRTAGLRKDWGIYGLPFESYNDWLTSFWSSKLGRLFFVLGNRIHGLTRPTEVIIAEIDAMVGERLEFV